MPEIVIRRNETRMEPMGVTLGPSDGVRIFVDQGATATVHVLLDDEKKGRDRRSVQADLARGASLTVVTVISGESESMEISQHSRVSESASILWQNVTLGGAEVTQHLVSEVDGDHARSDVEWVFFAKGPARHDLSACNVFYKGNGGGEITVKGVTQDSALARIKGMIDIAPGGGGTHTFLRADALMLDRTSKVDIIPALEIKTNDVKASHAATVSRVTEEELFYFASRGILEGAARRMYILGFLGDLVGRIVDRDLKIAVDSAIRRCLCKSAEILI